MFGLGKRRRQVVEHHGGPSVEDQLRQALRERDAAFRHREDAEAYARGAADRLNEERRVADRAIAERDEATRELRAAGNARANFFEALFAGAPHVADMEGTSEQVALWYVRELRRQLAEVSADLAAAAAFEAALSLHIPESWDGEEAFAAIADDFVRTVTERLIALGGSLDKHPEFETSGDAVQAYSGSSKVAATFHGADAEPRCSAHGTVRCETCSLNNGRRTCDECVSFEATGMHWDTCPNRVR